MQCTDFNGRFGIGDKISGEKDAACNGGIIPGGIRCVFGPPTPMYVLMLLFCPRSPPLWKILDYCIWSHRQPYGVTPKAKSFLGGVHGEPPPLFPIVGMIIILSSPSPLRSTAKINAQSIWRILVPISRQFFVGPAKQKWSKQDILEGPFLERRADSPILNRFKKENTLKMIVPDRLPCWCRLKIVNDGRWFDSNLSFDSNSFIVLACVGLLFLAVLLLFFVNRSQADVVVVWSHTSSACAARSPVLRKDTRRKSEGRF